MRNGRPYAIKIAPAAVIAFAALAVGYGLGEQAHLMLAEYELLDALEAGKKEENQ